MKLAQKFTLSFLLVSLIGPHLLQGLGSNVPFDATDTTNTANAVSYFRPIFYSDFPSIGPGAIKNAVFCEFPKCVVPQNDG